MATNPADHPLHKVPEDLPRPPGDLPPNTEGPSPSRPPQRPPESPDPYGSKPYLGESKNEEGDPVGTPARQ